jgi:hypothetical protein
VEQPAFSGFARYKAVYEHTKDGTNTQAILVISDAAEGVEVFVNGKSLGIEITPPMRYDITKHLKPGQNERIIEVATTLERQCYPLLDQMGKAMAPVPSGESGLTGCASVFVK